jgi:transposase
MVIKTVRESVIYFTDSEKRQIIDDYLGSGLTKQDIWEKYTGRKQEHGQIVNWMRRMGYKDKREYRIANLAVNPPLMSKKKLPVADNGSVFETAQLKSRIASLEQQLKDAELKAIAFSTMVDIAEKEFKIPIRKKFNTKP